MVDGIKKEASFFLGVCFCKVCPILCVQFAHQGCGYFLQGVLPVQIYDFGNTVILGGNLFIKQQSGRGARFCVIIDIMPLINGIRILVVVPGFQLSAADPAFIAIGFDRWAERKSTGKIIYLQSDVYSLY
jgi:hypothetical protein